MATRTSPQKRPRRGEKFKPSFHTVYLPCGCPIGVGSNVQVPAKTECLGLCKRKKAGVIAS
jgi:hypothetical protein